MILTIHTLDQTYHIHITADQFTQLRNPNISIEEVQTIATNCDIALDILIEYVNDLKKAAQEQFELDGSCDYSDHL
jgi:hypothetical protein